MILLIVGIVAFLVGVAFAIMGSSRRTTFTDDIRNTPQGRERVMEQRDSMSP